MQGRGPSQGLIADIPWGLWSTNCSWVFTHFEESPGSVTSGCCLLRVLGLGGPLGVPSVGRPVQPGAASWKRQPGAGGSPGQPEPTGSGVGAPPPHQACRWHR